MLRLFMYRELLQVRNFLNEDREHEFCTSACHTEYSLLDGSNKIKEYVARVKELGMNSAAITDHGVMYGVIDFYREARAQGIKPILAARFMWHRVPVLIKKQPAARTDIIIWCCLLKITRLSEPYEIVSTGFGEGFYYKPRVDKEVLRKYHEGILCTSACLAGEVQKYIQRGMYEEGLQVCEGV